MDGITYNKSGHFAHFSYFSTQLLHKILYNSQNIRAYSQLNHRIRCFYKKSKELFHFLIGVHLGNIDIIYSRSTNNIEHALKMVERTLRSVFWLPSLLLQEIIFFLLFFCFLHLLVSVESQLTMELGTIPALSYVLELLRYQWQILSFVRCQNFEMKDWSKLSQNSYGLKRITWISDGVIQFLSNILPVSHFNPLKPAAQRQRYPCGKNPDWHVPPFIQGLVPNVFWEIINGKRKIQIRLK